MPRFRVTGSETRRVDLRFGIYYDDDIDIALRVLHQIVEQHPLVLDEPQAADCCKRAF